MNCALNQVSITGSPGTAACHKPATVQSSGFLFLTCKRRTLSQPESRNFFKEWSGGRAASIMFTATVNPPRQRPGTLYRCTITTQEQSNVISSKGGARSRRRCACNTWQTLVTQKKKKNASVHTFTPYLLHISPLGTRAGGQKKKSLTKLNLIQITFLRR